MANGPSYGFDTLQIHAGSSPDPATGSRQTPIYQSTAFVFQNSEHAARLFNLQEVGYIYSRLTNPTIATCLLYTSPSPRDKRQSRMPSSA